MQRYIGELILIFVLVLLNGYFAAAEIALISTRRATLKAKADAKVRGAKAALDLTEDPSRLLASTQVGITLIGFMASATAAVSLAEPVAKALRSLNVPWVTNAAGGLAVVLVTLAISYLTLVIGELAPKRLGLQRAESVSLAVSRPLNVLSIVARPVVWVLARSTDAVGLLFGLKPGVGKPGVSEEEIKLLVTEQGSLLDEEKRMIHEIFELGDTVAREIMVPRVDIEMIEDDTTIGQAIEVFTRTGFSRLPVFHEDPDRIIGILLLKDLVNAAAEGRLEAFARVYAREPYFVPETKLILPLLSEMRTLQNHMVVVVDEYGGTSGIATIEDIIEEVIGEIADEFDRERRHITPLTENEWVIDGRLSVEEAREILHLDVPESTEYETLAGWVLAELGHIPIVGETVVRGDTEYRVQAVRRRRIARLYVKRTPAEQPAGR